MGNRITIFTFLTLLVFIKIVAGEINVSEKYVTNPKISDDLCFTPACLRSASRILTRMNSSAKPCDDFYEFVCGNFAKSWTMPSDHFKMSPLENARTEVQSRLRQIIEDIDESNAPKHFKMVKTHYKNCMKDISGWKSGDTLIRTAKQDLQARNGWPLAFGNDWNETRFDYQYTLLSLFNFGSAPDIKNSTVWIPHFREKDPPLHKNYLKEGFSNKIVQAYYQYMVDIAVAFGIEKSAAEISLNETLHLEIELHQVVFPRNNYHDLYHRYSQTTYRKLEKKYPNLPFTKLTSESDSVLQMELDEESMERVNEWMSQKPKQTLANWEAWRFVADDAPFFQDYVSHRTKIFNRIFTGITREDTESERCVRSTQFLLGFALGALYQRKYISQSSVNDLIVILDNMKQQFIGFIEKAEWLGIETKRNALNKVSHMKSSLETCRELILDDELETYYHDLQLPDGSFDKTLSNEIEFENKLETSKLNEITPSMCGQFLMSTEYLAELNFLRVSTEILTNFFYDIDRPKYLNFGAAGMAIGREMMQSLNIENRYYDKNGNLNPWWDSDSNEKYINRTQCFIDQYGNYTVDEFKIHVNGFLTQNENIADNLGAKAAYHAYVNWTNANEPEKHLPGLDFSPKQMFWISMANSFCAKYRPEYLMSSIYEDPHSPDKFRINGAFSNLQEFSNDFKCDLGTKMNPVKKCYLW